MRERDDLVRVEETNRRVGQSAQQRAELAGVEQLVEAVVLGGDQIAESQQVAMQLHLVQHVDEQEAQVGQVESAQLAQLAGALRASGLCALVGASHLRVVVVVVVVVSIAARLALVLVAPLGVDHPAAERKAQHRHELGLAALGVAAAVCEQEVAHVQVGVVEQLDALGHVVHDPLDGVHTSHVVVVELRLLLLLLLNVLKIV